MQKEIIINEDNLKDNEITNKRLIKKYLVIENDKILFKMHHNTYYLLNEDDITSQSGNLFLIKKEYIKDYPFFLENSLIQTNYYILKENISFKDGKWIVKEKAREVIENNRYDNPRNQNITNEILQILDIIDL